jgi:SAM-dependent methyltransferase
MSARATVLGALFELLYRNRLLYWLASTVPFAGQWRVWQRRVLPRIVGRHVLEVGCGIGTLLGDLVAAGYVCRAVDASPQMVRAAQAELRRRHLDTRGVRVVRAQVQRLPFTDAAFDTVVCTFPTPYIYEPRAIQEIARVLRPEGRLVVVEAAALLPARAWLLPFVLLQRLAYGRARPHPPSHPHHPPASSRANTVITIEVPGRQSGIPLEAAGLRRREEVDRSSLWEVAVTIGDKPAAGPVAAARATALERGRN